MSAKWDPVEVLTFVNPEVFSCVGDTKDGRRCTRQINVDNRGSARRLAVELSRIPVDDDLAMGPTLEKLATIMLCQKDHQSQRNIVVAAWLNNIKNHPRQPAVVVKPEAVVYATPEKTLSPFGGELLPLPQKVPFKGFGLPPTPEKTPDRTPWAKQNNHKSPSEQSCEEWPGSPSPSAVVKQERMDVAELLEQYRAIRLEAQSLLVELQHVQAQRQADEEREQQRKNRQAEQRAAERQAEKDHQRELHRIAEQERQHREALQDLQAEEERIDEARRQLRAERQQLDQDRRQFERLRREQHDEAVRQAWQECWHQHKRDMEKFSCIDTDVLDEDIKHSIPWPVMSGRYVDVTAQNVRDFFESVPFDTEDGLSREGFLRRQLERWQPKRLHRQFRSARKSADVSDRLDKIAITLTELLREHGAQDDSANSVSAPNTI